jgi:aryl-alcohol dehydrogenase-like predicted oxidoreductase
MEYRPLGRTGVRVSPVCLGTAFRGQVDEAVCIRTIHRALGLGCNFIDTAFYGQGRSEEVVGKALTGKRDEVVLTTKVFGTQWGDANSNGLSRLNLMRGLEASLRRLQTDYVDLYLLHSFDPHTPIEETVGALDDMVRQGKVRYVGCSNWQAWKVMEALWIADRRNLAPFRCIQSQYSLLNRLEIEPELMPLCREFGLGIMAYSPLAIGLLTGTYRRGQAPPPNTPWSKGELIGMSPGKYDFDEAMTEPVDAIVQALIDIGQRHGRTPSQVAIAWILDHDEVTAPILGADLPEHVDDAFGGLDWAISAAERSQLDGLSAPDVPRKYS